MKSNNKILAGIKIRAGTRILEYGGGGGGGRIESRWHDVSGVSREGGEYERGLPPFIFSPGKIWKVVVPENHFQAYFW